MEIDPKQLGGHAELAEIEAEAQRAINEASELLRYEATRKEHPMEIAKKFDLRYDPEQLGKETNDQASKFDSKFKADKLQKGTDGHLEFELQKHNGANKLDKSDNEKNNYHLFYDVEVPEKSKQITPLPIVRKNQPPSLTLEKALPLLEKIAQEIISEEKDQDQSSRNGNQKIN